MPSSLNPESNLQAINAVLERTRGSSERFSETLRHEHIQHLSFTQVSTVEGCQRRYFLQYVVLADPVPVPDYFTKGKLLHQLIAASYESLRRDEAISREAYIPIIEGVYTGEAGRHLQNAVDVHLENLWLGYEIVGIEQPFVLSVDPALPPCVGVIDLVLRQGERFVIVDHKTGRDFSPQDELQMAIYVEYIRREYGGKECAFYYDHYRWVNNLQRIRKPPFQRTRVVLPKRYWEAAEARIHAAQKTIERIRRQGWGMKNGQCFRCPFKSIC